MAAAIADTRSPIISIHTMLVYILASLSGWIPYKGHNIQNYIFQIKIKNTYSKIMQHQYVGV